MELDEAFALWRKLEYKYPVDKWQINGVAVWPVIRLILGYHTSAYSQNNKKSIAKWRQYSNRIIKVWADRVRLLAKDRRHQQKLDQADIVFLGDTGDRNVLMPDGTLLDHNHDPLKILLNRAGYTIFSFEELGHDMPRMPRWSNSYAIDMMVLKCLFRKKLLKKYNKPTEIHMELYDEFKKELLFNGIEIYALMINELISQVVFLNDLADAFVDKLKRIKPRIVIHECWYAETKMALALAAHRLNIPVVEIQHGVAAGSGRHPSYYDWTKIPNGGYALMPDYMWVWDESDYDAMIPWAKESMRPFIGGHPMNLIWSDSDNELNKYYQTKYEKEYGNDRPAILMTLQWGTNYPQWIIDFINQHDEFTWLIRLHPVIDECEKIFMLQIKDAENIHKESTGSFPLEILLNNVAIHITMHSSVVLDALPFACPSIVMHPKAKEMYSKQITEKVAYYADNAETLQTKINDLLVQSNKNVVSNEMQKQYKVGNDAIKKIIDIIDNSKPSWE